MKRAQASAARQRLLETERARAAHVGDLVGADRMVEGSFVTLGRKCGKPTCRCATGERHYGKFLSRSVAGRTQMLFVPQGQEVAVAAKAERYRRFRQARAELMKLAAQTAKAADTLQAALTEPYPKSERPRRLKKGARHGRR